MVVINYEHVLEFKAAGPDKGDIAVGETGALNNTQYGSRPLAKILEDDFDIALRPNILPFEGCVNNFGVVHFHTRIHHLVRNL